MNKFPQSNRHLTRKKIIATNRVAPIPDENRNQGHTFVHLKSQEQFNGSKEIQSMIKNTIMNDINKKCQTVWGEQQKFAEVKNVFSISQNFIKIIAIIVLVAMAIIFMENFLRIHHFEAILLLCMVIIWGITMSLAIYIFCNKYVPFSSDEQFIQVVHTNLMEYNEKILKELGYQAKSDEWATWISFTLMNYSEDILETVSQDSNPKDESEI